MAEQRKGLGCIPAIAICAVALLVAIYAIWPSDNEMTATRDAALANRAEISVTADEFIDAFDRDAEAARTRFDGKVIAITGQLKAVRPDNRDGTVMSLATQSGTPLDASIERDDSEAATAIKVGDQVAIRCATIIDVLGVQVPARCRLK